MASHSLQHRFHAATQEPQAQLGRLRLDLKPDHPHPQPVAQWRSHGLTITREFGDLKVSCSCGQVSAPMFFRVDAVLWRCPTEDAEMVGVKNWEIWAQRAAEAARDEGR